MYHLVYAEGPRSGISGRTVQEVIGRNRNRKIDALGRITLTIDGEVMKPDYAIWEGEPLGEDGPDELIES